MVFSFCNFCNAKFAVLYCTADSANLCLLCDRHVHSANALSLKHTRWWICHNCRAKQASVSTFSKNGLLLLCQGCSTSCNLKDQSHTNCSTAGDFSGCPSANSLASILGFKNLLDDQKVVNNILDVSSVKDELCEQLVEMGKKDLVRELRPRTPPSRRSSQTTSFTSLLVLSENLGLTQGVSVSDVADDDEEEDLLWDYNPTYDSSLVCLEKDRSKFCTFMSFFLLSFESCSWKLFVKLRSCLT